jgi:hypothetical protein
MWVKHDKTIINHPQIIAIFIGGMFTIPMGGLLNHSFTHIIP